MPNSKLTVHWWIAGVSSCSGVRVSVFNFWHVCASACCSFLGESVEM